MTAIVSSNKKSTIEIGFYGTTEKKKKKKKKRIGGNSFVTIKSFCEYKECDYKKLSLYFIIKIFLYTLPQLK